MTIPTRTAYDRLSVIIPEAQALGNKAWATSLQQITGITNMTLSQLADSFLAVEHLDGLPLVNALTTPVPPAVVAALNNAIGVNGQKPVMVNGIGTAIGYVQTTAINNAVAVIGGIGTGYLQTVYQTMLNVVNDKYKYPNPSPPPDYIVRIPPGNPGAGDYKTKDEAITKLIGIANSTIAGLNNQQLNTYWNQTGTQIKTESDTQKKAGIDVTKLSGGYPSTYGFIFSLPSYGAFIEPNNTRDFITALAVQSTLQGQAIIGVMRQGINQTALSATGVGTSIEIPLPPQP